MRMKARVHALGALVAGLVLSPQSVTASGPGEPLPVPLTLEHALAVAVETHPDIELQRARIDLIDAERSAIQADNGLGISIGAELRAISPSDIAYDQSNNDSRLGLRLSKVLYDFGRTRHQLASNAHDRSGSLWRFLESRQQKHLQVLTNYLEVLLADLAYIRDNEFMTMAYLRWDKARERNLLGQVSDIATLELEAEFNKWRRERQVSQNRQRLTRSRLAISLNRPDELSSSLAEPAFEERTRGDFEAIMTEVLANNPRLRALRDRVRAAEADVEWAKSGDNPILRGELKATHYERMSGSYNPLEGGLVIDIPLFSGGAVDAEVAGKRAELRQRRAELAQGELEVRQAALDLWMELGVLELQREEMRSLGEYRELYLDRSRALYEMEVQADIGDAQAQISDFQYRRAETIYRTAIGWAQFDALRGELGDFSREDLQLTESTGQ